MNREDYLQKAIDILRPDFHIAGFSLPEHIRVSVGFPSRGGLGKKKRVIGECWSDKAATDRSHAIFISPMLGKADEALATLVHECLHTAVGVEHKHKGPFRKGAKAIGLVGKLTETTAGDALKARLEEVAALLGPYPHSALFHSAGEKKQTCRLLKVICPECGCICRMSQLATETPGCPTCACGGQMELEVTDEAEEGGDDEQP